MEIQNHTVVSLRYVMKNENGEVLEENLQSEPVQYVHGCRRILPALENSVVGMIAGDTKTFLLSDPQLNGIFQFSVSIDSVRAATKEEINSGIPLSKDCGPGCCC